MPVEDRRRAQLRAAATTSLGEEAADTLMDLVTPAGHEVATRADIDGVLVAMDAMDNRLTGQLVAVDTRLDHMDERWSERLTAMEQRLTATFERGLREAITSQTRAVVGSLLVSVVAIAGLAFGLSG